MHGSRPPGVSDISFSRACVPRSVQSIQAPTDQRTGFVSRGSRPVDTSTPDEVHLQNKKTPFLQGWRAHVGSGARGPWHSSAYPWGNLGVKNKGGH